MLSAADSPNEVTLASYEAAADLYAERTADWPGRTFAQLLDTVAALAPAGGWVLELGSGTGRDADLLEARGLRVRRTDGAAAFVARMRAAGRGAEVLNMLRDDFGGPYDVVFASAVFLHLSTKELAVVLGKAAMATRGAGLLVFTVKQGDGAAWSTVKLDRPRHFTYWQAPELTEVLNRTAWELLSLRHVPGRGEDWLFVVCRRSTY